MTRRPHWRRLWMVHGRSMDKFWTIVWSSFQIRRAGRLLFSVSYVLRLPAQICQSENRYRSFPVALYKFKAELSACGEHSLLNTSNTFVLWHSLRETWPLSPVTPWDLYCYWNVYLLTASQESYAVDILSTSTIPRYCISSSCHCNVRLKILSVTDVRDFQNLHWLFIKKALPHHKRRFRLPLYMHQYFFYVTVYTCLSELISNIRALNVLAIWAEY